MSYIDGFVATVPQENKQAYLDHAREARSLFKDHGATRMVENWGDDVPEGKVTDFHRSAQKKDGEAVVLSWIEWPSKKARDEAWPKLMADPRMQPNKDNMPFDGKRMIYGGLATILDARNRKPCNPSTTHFAKGCPSCFRYVPLAMSQALVLIARLARGVGIRISGS